MGPEPINGAQEEQSPQPQTSPTGRIQRVSLVVGGAGVASFATVGLIKKFYEEGIEIEMIVASGWPTLFALGNGFLKSIHDLEWFASRLDKKDFNRMGSIDFRQELDPSTILPSIILQSFPQTLLNQSKVPVVIAAINTDLGEPDVFGSGEWKEPLLRTIAVPGIYRKFDPERGTGWIEGISALDVREAFRRGSQAVVAVSMYDDYLNHVTSKRDDELIRRVFAGQLRKSIADAFRLTPFTAQIELKRDPTDYSAKRAAHAAGYREASKLIQKLRGPASTSTN